jgi:hypothetical protein
MPDGWSLNWPEPASKWQQHRDWAWRALQVKRIDAARKHAVAAVKIKPTSKESWRVLYCALRGR